jgi:DNA polymerase-3 subunit beta
MKVDTSQLKSALETVIKATAPKGLPILANVLLSASDSRLSLSATNLEISITTYIPAAIYASNGEEPFATTIPAKTITDLVKLIGNPLITLEHQKKVERLAIHSKGSEALLNGVSAKEFPPIARAAQPDAWLARFTLPAQDFKEAVLQVAFAATDDEARLVLTGVHFRLVGDHLTLEAADGFRMARVSMPLSNPPGITSDLIIPVKALRLLVANLKNAEELTIAVNGSHVLFAFSGVEITSQLLDGRYPDLKDVIPAAPRVTLAITKNDLTAAVRSCKIFSDNNLVTLSLAGDKLVVSADGANGANEYTVENLPIEGLAEHQEPFRIRLNADFLLEAAASSRPNLVFGFIDKNTIVKLTTDQEGFVQAIMPAFLE